MKTTLIILVVMLLVVGSVGAQTYTVSPRLDSMTAYCLEQLNLPAGGNRRISTGLVHRRLNEGYGATCTQAPAIEKFDTLLVWKDYEGAAWPSDCDRIDAVFRIFNGDTIRYPLYFVDPEGIRNAFVDSPMVQLQVDPESPEHAYTFGRRLLFTPKIIADSAAPDTFLILYFAVGTKLTSGSDSCKVGPKYLPAVLNYAMARVQEAREKWTSAAHYQARYDRIVAEPPVDRGKVKK